MQKKEKNYGYCSVQMHELITKFDFISLIHHSKFLRGRLPFNSEYAYSGLV